MAKQCIYFPLPKNAKITQTKHIIREPAEYSYSNKNSKTWRRLHSHRSPASQSCNLLIYSLYSGNFALRPDTSHPCDFSVFSVICVICVIYHIDCYRCCGHAQWVRQNRYYHTTAVLRHGSESSRHGSSAWCKYFVDGNQIRTIIIAH